MEIDQNIFYEEFINKIDSLDDALIAAPNDFTDKENLNEIFRSLHTIKGVADLLGMFEVVSLVHKAEDFLDLIRHDEAQLDIKILKLLVEFKEYLHLCVDNTANGIYDDPTTQNLSIYFEKEFEKIIKMIQDGAFEVSVKTILIVESTSITRYMIKKVASDEGLSSFMCDNGFDAMKKIKDNDVDLILCDISENCEKGRAFLEHVSSDLLYDHIPIVLIVDYLTTDMRKFAQKVEAKAWLKKPIEVSKLTTILNKLLVK